jgi:ArsR family transcriptional regulator, cadmium/lead-responsive transcriptional repressor
MKLKLNGDITKYASDLSYLLASPLSKRVLSALKLSYMTPTNISKTLKISLSNVSTKLSELRKRGLVSCITPERKKCRIYVITEKGKVLLEIVPNGYKTNSELIYYEDQI